MSWLGSDNNFTKSNFLLKTELEIALNKLGDPYNEMPTENQPAGGITFEPYEMPTENQPAGGITFEPCS